MDPTTFRCPVRSAQTRKSTQGGFTLIEIIMVIVILGVIGAVLSVFIKSPIDAYLDSARRAGLTDAADTTLRRITRDIRTALPNSLRQASGGNAINNQCIEFIPTKTGGRYRAEVDATGLGDVLRFDVADNSFDMFGSNSLLPDQSIAVGDLVVIYNLGIPGADAYASQNPNVSAITQVSAGSLLNETKISINSLQFPLASGGSGRFGLMTTRQGRITSLSCVGGSLECDGKSVSSPAAVRGEIIKTVIDKDTLLVKIPVGTSLPLPGSRLIVRNPAYIAAAVYEIVAAKIVKTGLWSIRVNMPFLLARGVVKSSSKASNSFASRTPIMKLRVNPGLFDGKCIRPMLSDSAPEYRLTKATEEAMSLSNVKDITSFPVGGGYVVLDVGTGDTIEIVGSAQVSFPDVETTKYTPKYVE